MYPRDNATREFARVGFPSFALPDGDPCRASPLTPAHPVGRSRAWLPEPRRLCRPAHAPRLACRAPRADARNRSLSRSLAALTHARQHPALLLAAARRAYVHTAAWRRAPNACYAVGRALGLAS